MRYKGSFTIEAALIMPVILGVIVLFVRIGMICMDSCTMEYACQTACSSAVYEYGNEENAAEEQIRQILDSKLLCDWDCEINVSSDARSITATVIADPPLFSKPLVRTAGANKHFCPNY